MRKQNTLIVILGPTASGKTDMSLQLAKKFNGEIINADSRQIYREMKIGVGSPFAEIRIHEKIAQKRGIFEQILFLNKIPHHLFHIISPEEEFSLAQYKKITEKTIVNIQKRNNPPFLVGGTGLYISAIVDNLQIPEALPNKKIRNDLIKKSKKYLFYKLKKIDPESAKIIDFGNKRRIIRALEVYKITGKPFSIQRLKGKSLFRVLQIGIKVDRKKLYDIIDKRVEKMIREGLVEETTRLYKKYNCDLPSMSGIGYKEIISYLKNEISLYESIQKIKYRTHQYARRQMTWFKRDKRIKWIDNYKEAEKLVGRFID